MNDSRPRRLALGRVVPGLLAAVCGLDAVLRVVLPVELVTFRAWEAATRYAPYEAPFEPNRRFQLSREYGDLANLGNVRSFREYRAGTAFTTDSRGFRNPSTHRESHFGAVLVGDSFGVGATVEDSETLAAQLGRLSGRHTYNASGLQLLLQEPASIVRLAQQLGMRSGLVINESLQGRLAVPGQAAAEDGVRGRLVASIPRRVLDVLVRLRGLWRVSPLEIVVNRGVRALEDGHILPNSHASAVVQRTLRNGEKMLFLPEDVEFARSIPPVSIDHWVRLASTLGEADLKLLVVLVPRKYTVYQPLLEDEDATRTEVGGSLGPVERQFQDAGIAVLNLTETFRALAAKELDRGKYLYWRDDTHWNARGIGVAASEISRVWPAEVASLCGRGKVNSC